MQRRSVLKWISGGWAALTTAVVAWPAVQFTLSAVRGGKQAPLPLQQRVARLRDLPPGKAVQVSLVGNQRDAWTTYPDEVLGRVWLVRTGEADGAPETATVRAFTSVCPHLGCQIQKGQDGQGFVCPCHRAAFALDGQPVADRPGQKNHAPRGMDSLECRIVQDENQQEWWVEVTYQAFEPGLTTQRVRV